jgi:alkylation response protein AidB-like acyl-CoA dehydrogenase
MPTSTLPETLAGAGRLDAGLTAVSRHCRGLAPELREAGVLLDRDPDAITGMVDLQAVKVMRAAATPQQYQRAADAPDEVKLTGTSCLEWTVVLEGIAYGDASVVLGGPGPSLSGAAVVALGSPAQREEYFAKLAGPTWTFFALTEPDKGSAVLELETRLDRDPDADGRGWLLNGEKRYVGNAARAQLGVVFCRRAPGPWGIEAVLVDTADPGFHGELLPTVGLRGARLSRLRFDGVRIAEDRVLGLDRPPSRRGFYGAWRTLLRCRPTIAGMALGVTQAVFDYVREQRPDLPRWRELELSGLERQVAAVRRQTYDVAADIDRETVNQHRIGAVKMRAAQLGVQATLLAADLLGPASLLEHPWLAKAYRDMRGFELMEGAANLHRVSVFQGLLKDDFFAEAAQ